MGRRFLVLLLLLSALPGSPAQAEVVRDLSLQGMTGLLNTPNALVTPSGQVDLGYSNQVEGQWRDQVVRQDNYYVSFGWLKYLELGARLTEAPGKTRDLSASAKLQLPLLPVGWPLLAAGVQDVSGGAPNLRSRYLVASQTPLPWLRLSLGYGRGPDRLDGVFGGGEVQLTDWLQILAEHDGSEAAAGLRLSTPEALLPWPLRFSLTAKHRLAQDGDTNLALTLSLPLGNEHRAKSVPDELGSGGISSAPAVAEKPNNPAPAPVRKESVGADGAVSVSPAESTTAPKVAAPLLTDPAVLHLQQVLLAQGFEAVRVGLRDGRNLLVEFENSQFNQNEVDALGLVLGTALEELPPGLDGFTLRLLNGELVVAELRGPLAPFRKFFSRPESPGPSELASLSPQLQVVAAPTAAGHDSWATPSGNPRLFHVGLVVAPGLDTGVGTEFGVFDYRLSLRPDAYLQLWPGATLRTLVNIPLAWSDDYQAGGQFNQTGNNDTTVERVLANQVLHPAPGLLTMFSGGQFRRNLLGGSNETVWSAPDGRHQLRLKAGMFHDDRLGERYTSLLGTYRYDWPEAALQMETTAGRFVYGDRGFLVEVRRFFGDTAVGFFYADTDNKIGGIRISLPLTGRRDMAAAPVQVRGTSQWDYQLHSVLAKPGERNPLVFNSGVLPQTEYTLERDFLNRDRLSEAYLRDQLPRMLEAYWRYRSGIQ